MLVRFFNDSLQCIVRFVTFSFPKKVLTNRVLLTNRGVTSRRMHCLLLPIKTFYVFYSFIESTQSSVLQAVHAGFAVGAMLCAPLARPFLGEYDYG